MLKKISILITLKLEIFSGGDKMEKLLLIDGSAFIFRGYFGSQTLVNRYLGKNGEHTNAIRTVYNMFSKTIARTRATHVLVAYDTAGKTFRNDLYEDYKAHRDAPPIELSEQYPKIEELTSLLGLKKLSVENMEADDIIGTYARISGNAGLHTVVVTGDRDLTQLVTKNVSVEILKTGNKVEVYTPEYFVEKNGIAPDLVPDIKGLAGDASDNIPGVTKVGEKTAIKLLNEYQSVENLYQNIEQMKESKLKEHLIQDEALAHLSKELATIKTDVDVPFKLSELEYNGLPDDKMPLIDFLTELNMTTQVGNVLRRI
jgi:DNA polymerase-1